MTECLNVVEFSRTHLPDIPAQLRKLADAIERGDHGDVQTMYALKANDGHYPTVWGWGDVERGNDPIIQFELAKMYLLNNIVA